MKVDHAEAREYAESLAEPSVIEGWWTTRGLRNLGRAYLDLLAQQDALRKAFQDEVTKMESE